MVWQRDQRDQRATGKHPSTVQSSSSNLHPVVKNSSADVPGTAEDPAAVHGAQQVALRSKKPSEYPSMWGEKIWENRYVTRGWLWSITRNDFHDMTYGRIDYWMVLNGVEWCWMVLNEPPFAWQSVYLYVAWWTCNDLHLSVRNRRITALSSLPLTPNGKIDKQRLIAESCAEALVGWFTHFNADFPW